MVRRNVRYEAAVGEERTPERPTEVQDGARPPERVPESSRDSLAGAGWTCREIGSFIGLVTSESRPFWWMDPGPIWRSRNQVLGDLIEDPTNDERREWMRVQRETGTVPEDLGDGGAFGNGEPQRGIVGDLLPQKLGGHYDGGPRLALIEESGFDRTIAIETLGVGTTEFDLSEEWAMGLFRSGRTAAEKFLADYQTQGSMERPTMAPRTP